MADENRKPYGRHDPDMDLPAGKTCGDCAHFRRCNLMFGHIAADESCDWAPSRFLPKPAAAGVSETGHQTKSAHPPMDSEPTK